MHFLTDFGQRWIPAADDRDAGGLLRADLIDRGDEAGEVEVGRAGDPDLDAELVGDLLHADVVVLHEQRQVRLVGDPVVDLLGVGRAELGVCAGRCRWPMAAASAAGGDGQFVLRFLLDFLPPLVSELLVASIR